MSNWSKAKSVLATLFADLLQTEEPYPTNEDQRRKALKAEAHSLTQYARKNFLPIEVTLEPHHKSDDRHLINMTVTVHQGADAYPAHRRIATSLHLSSQNSVDNGLAKVKDIFRKECHDTNPKISVPFLTSEPK